MSCIPKYVFYTFFIRPLYLYTCFIHLQWKTKSCSLQQASSKGVYKYMKQLSYIYTRGSMITPCHRNRTLKRIIEHSGYT